MPALSAIQVEGHTAISLPLVDQSTDDARDSVKPLQVTKMVPLTHRAYDLAEAQNLNRDEEREVLARGYL